MNIALPLITRIVRRLYELLLHYGTQMTVFLTTLSAAFYYFYSSRRYETFRHNIQIAILVMPVIGHIFQKYFLCISCRSTATLLECGRPLPAILEQLSQSSPFDPYKKAWKFSRSEIERGVSLSESLRSFQSIFPSIMPDMLGIGERTGTLATMFHHVGRMYEEELEDFIRQLSSSIEPLLMIVMGLVVGMVALSIILPIYEITNHLSK